MDLILFKLLYFLLFFGLSSIAGMLIPFLQYKGFSPIETATLISFYTVSGILGQLIAGCCCDKLKTIKKIFIFSLLGVMFSTALAIFINIKILFYISFVIMGFFYYILTSIPDSWVIESGENAKSKFGFFRAFGSTGWAFGVLASGIITEKYGYHILNIIYLIMLSLTLFISIKIKDTVKEYKGCGNLKELFNNKEYILTVIILLIICIPFRGYCQLVPYRIEYVGGNTVNLGIFNFISSISEIAMLILAQKIMHKLSPDKLLLLSPLGLFLQILILRFGSNINIIYISAVLQAFTLPIILVVGKIIIDRISPSNLKTSSQLVAFAIFNSVSTIIGTASVGYFIEKFSLNKANLFLLGCNMLSILGALYYDKSIKDRTI
ncbi:MFS transporter [Romboutsia sp. 1001713B170131_170501_G6]|uniref:MFS transporter n=1 Tax=Romboutsia sp. 1001713B170131_170501_G6 TaxID=2787108 RepID=UPI0018A8FB81|nr:MFS transporter [Romboutsia sp. 1001713B170131_170501_G6]